MLISSSCKVGTSCIALHGFNMCSSLIGFYMVMIFQSQVKINQGHTTHNITIFVSVEVKTWFILLRDGRIPVVFQGQVEGGDFQWVYQGPEEYIKILEVFRNSKSSVNPIKIQLDLYSFSLT